MKKRIITSLLASILLTSSLTGCQLVGEGHIYTPTESKDSRILTKYSEVTESTPSKIADVSERCFLDYETILKKYRDLLLQKKNKEDMNTNESNFFESDCVIEEAIKFVSDNSSTSLMGYAIYDINNDRQDELFLMDEHYHIYAAFTQINGTPVLLDKFSLYNHYVSVDENGIFYKTGYGKGENSYTKIMKIAADGIFEIILEYGCFDDGSNLQYYVIENNNKTIVELSDIINLQEHYCSLLHNPSNITKTSGMVFIPVM